ncbi:hypothetical protein P7K49_005809 [Saguinus oedipus]|uniref:Uncharacterized protein n=1 Tax=Saguinus oedipus TaxID=9490 RepID=A0ABQ9W0L8_SAGOE|nr:hypothetical protein P7K49_005809 [Saguinus oedipus]
MPAPPHWVAAPHGGEWDRVLRWPPLPGLGFQPVLHGTAERSMRDSVPHSGAKGAGRWALAPVRPYAHLKITSSSPSHPANSFYYPRLKALPPIARVTLVRLRQSPRAFVPPPSVLASRDNEIVDSASGKDPLPIPHTLQMPGKSWLWKVPTAELRGITPGVEVLRFRGKLSVCHSLIL